MGASNYHPYPLDFNCRMRWFILGKNPSSIFTENKNTEEHGEECLVKLLTQTENSIDDDAATCLTQSVFSNLTNFDPNF